MPRAHRIPKDEPAVGSSQRRLRSARTNIGFVGPNSFGRARNSEGLILDAALRELTGLKAGDRVNLTVHEGGTIVITPMRATLTKEDAAAHAKTLIRRNSALFKRLA